ncbi:DUF1648 domain-containing protein [Ornithinibacillus salinisoli]|uniref:DUF1648 domain-containing protein n=1 Tax=Ornithinibacillus salinisoli TaxID=1848459 RepID=A0ABW4VW28_9BACI
MDNTVFFLLLLILLPVFISTMFIPYWTRKTESFGVSIPETYYYSTNLKQMRKKYVLQTGVLGLFIIAFLVFIATFFQLNEEGVSIYFGGLTFGYIILTFLIYLHFHQKMKELKENNGEKWAQKSQLVVIDTGFRNQKLTYSNFWFTISFFIAIFTMVITMQNYQQIPLEIPMKYNFAGDVTNFTEKSYRSVLILPIMQVYLTLLFILINIIISKAKQQVSVENPKESMQKNVTFRRRWSAFIIITGIALTAMFSMIQLSLIYPINPQLMTIVPLAFSLFVTIGAIVLSFTTGQGGSRVVSKEAFGKENIIDRDDDKYWKLGMFYFNKNDPALFLEKRFGVGWTNNWAHPLSWFIIIGIILLAAGIPFLLSL